MRRNSRNFANSSGSAELNCRLNSEHLEARHLLATFQGMGDFSPTDISANGMVAVGYKYSSSSNSYTAFRWTAEAGAQGLGAGRATGVSADGSVIVGGDYVNGNAFRWTAEAGMQGLGGLFPVGYFYSEAFGVSADGSTIVGQSYSSKGVEAFRWMAAGGMQELGFLRPFDDTSEAYSVSADGSVVVGKSYWIPYFAPEPESEAFRWTAEGGMQGLGFFLPGDSESAAYDLSADGSVIVGFSNSEAVRWTAGHGWHSVRQLLSDAGIDLSGWTLFSANAVSADGRTIVGHGISPSGQYEAWRAVLEPPAAIVVLTHGFGNQWNAPVIGSTTLIPGFLDNWHSLADKFESLPHPESFLADSVGTYVADWNSSDGWVDAALALVVSGVLVAQGHSELSDLAIDLAVDMMEQAEINANVAAQNIFDDLQASGLLATPEETQDGQQAIQLVGHSRGGAVNARLAELLTSEGYWVEEYIALDGYSKDWPFPSGILGDIDIAGTIASPTVHDNLGNAVNYLVEDGLVEVFFDLISPVADDLGTIIFGPLFGSVLTPVILDTVRNYLPDWKAQVRPGFNSNETIVGFNVNSNHLNVTEIYLDEPVAPEDPVGIKPYILDSYVGRNSGPAPASSRADSHFETRAASLATGSSDSFLTAFAEPYGFADWNIETTHGFVSAFQGEEVTNNAEPFVQLWGTLAGDPRYALASLWETAGDVVLSVDGDNALAQLTESAGTNSSLGQLVVFLTGDKTVEFTLNVLQAGIGDELRLTLDGVVVGAVPLSPGISGKHMITLPSDLPQAGTLVLTLADNGGEPAVVRVDNLMIAGTAGDFDRNGNIDGRDFLAWQRGQSPSPLSNGDLSDWQESYDPSEELSAISSPQEASQELRVESKEPDSRMARPWAVSLSTTWAAGSPCYDEAVCENSYISEVDHALEQFATSATLLGKPAVAPSLSFGEMATRRAISKRINARELASAL